MKREFSVAAFIVVAAQINYDYIAVDVIPEKVDKINNKKSPIQDDYIEKYLAEKELDLTATLDGASAYKDAEYVIIAAPTNVYPKFSVDFSQAMMTVKIIHYCRKMRLQGTGLGLVIKTFLNEMGSTFSFRIDLSVT